MMLFRKLLIPSIFLVLMLCTLGSMTDVPEDQDNYESDTMGNKKRGGLNKDSKDDKPVAESQPNPSSNNMGLDKPESESQPKPSSNNMGLDKPESESQPNPSSNNMGLDKPESESQPKPSSNNMGLDKPESESQPNPSSNNMGLDKPESESQPKPSSNNMGLDKPESESQPKPSSNNMGLDKPESESQPNPSSNNMGLDKPESESQPKRSSNNMGLDKPESESQPKPSSNNMGLDKPESESQPNPSSNNMGLDKPESESQPKPSSNNMDLDKPESESQPNPSSNNMGLDEPENVSQVRLLLSDLSSLEEKLKRVGKVSSPNMKRLLHLLAAVSNSVRHSQKKSRKTSNGTLTEEQVFTFSVGKPKNNNTKFPPVSLKVANNAEVTINGSTKGSQQVSYKSSKISNEKTKNNSGGHVSSNGNDKIDQLLRKFKHLNSKLKRMKKLMGKDFEKVEVEVDNLSHNVPSGQAVDKNFTGSLINDTLTSAESSIQKICLSPITKRLRIPKWAKWNEWGRCTQTCGSGGYRLRHRSCNTTTALRCLGNNFDIAPCDLDKCPAVWLTWGYWSQCSASCDHGLQVRTRTCLTSNIEGRCVGSTAEVKDCFEYECKASKKVPVDKNNTRPENKIKPNSGRNVHKETMLDVRTGRVKVPATTRPPPHGMWSTWSGWTTCKECGTGNRERRRICVNSTMLTPLGPKMCSGADVELVPCSGSACRLEQQFPNAPHVSEGHSVKLKCQVPVNVTPEKVYWITPTNHHIGQNTHNRRLQMYGTSLLLDNARFMDQGKYKCVMLFPNRLHHVHEAPLIVETCRDHPCKNNGWCVTTSDPDIKGSSNYHCSCPGIFSGSFCEIGYFSPNKYVGPIVIGLVALLFGLALVVFLVRRSKQKSQENNMEDHQWKKQGSLKGNKANRSADKSDVTNSSIVSQDDSFVEITADDYKDYDEFSLPHDTQEEGNDQESDGFEGSSLKYPSPRQRQSYGGEHQYVRMSPGSQEKDRRIRFSDQEDENIIYENVPFSDDPTYENVPGAREFHPDDAYETSNFKGQSPHDPVDVVAERLAEQCLIEIENEARKFGKPSPIQLHQEGRERSSIAPADASHTARPRSPSPSASTSTSSRNKMISYQPPVSQDPRSNQRAQVLIPRTAARSPGESPLGRGYRSPARVSPMSSIESREYRFPLKMPVMDKRQEAEFLKHFNPSFIPEAKSPSTSTPKKAETLQTKRVIMPADLVDVNDDADRNLLTLGMVKKNLAQEMMAISSENFMGQREQSQVNQGLGNMSSNNGALLFPEGSSGSEMFSSDSYYHTPQATSDTSSGRKDTFLSMNSSLKTLPDLDGTVSFPKQSYQSSPSQMSGESGNQYLISNYRPPYSLSREDAGEGSMYLSDFHYTPDASEVSMNRNTTPQSSNVDYEEGDYYEDDADVDDDEEDNEDNEEEDEMSASDVSSQTTMALRYVPKQDGSGGFF